MQRLEVHVLRMCMCMYLDICMYTGIYIYGYIHIILKYFS